MFPWPVPQFQGLSAWTPPTPRSSLVESCCQKCALRSSTDEDWLTKNYQSMKYYYSLFKLWPLIYEIQNLCWKSYSIHHFARSQNCLAESQDLKTVNGEEGGKMGSWEDGWSRQHDSLFLYREFIVGWALPTKISSLKQQLVGNAHPTRKNVSNVGVYINLAIK
jgi:hypothetical protein